MASSSAPPLPRRLSAEERREQIKRVAAHLFTERGFESVTIADLAAQLQTSRPTVYTYFPSTEAILDELLQDRLTLLLARLDPLIAQLRPPRPGPVPPQAIGTVFHFLLTEGDTLRLLHSGGAPTFQRRRHQFLNELGQRLSLAPDALVRREPHLMILLTSLLDALALRAVTDPDLDPQALAGSLATFAWGGARALEAELGGASPQPSVKQLD